MPYIVYNKETTRIVGRTFKTHSAAQASITRMRKRMLVDGPIVDPKLDPLFIYGIAEKGYFHDNIEKFVERPNVMTGKMMKIRVNTPSSCDPTSETYWCM